MRHCSRPPPPSAWPNIPSIHVGMAPVADTRCHALTHPLCVFIFSDFCFVCFFKATITGEITLLNQTIQPNAGATLTFNCGFGGAVAGYLHIDDHLVCTTGINSAPGQVLASTLDQPLMVLSRKREINNHIAYQERIRCHVACKQHHHAQWRGLIMRGVVRMICMVSIQQPLIPLSPPLSSPNAGTSLTFRLFALFNESSLSSPSGLDLNVTFGCSHGLHHTNTMPPSPPPSFVGSPSSATPPPPPPPPLQLQTQQPWYTLAPTMNALATQRFGMQANLSTGWGLWHQMSFVKHVLLPEGQVVTLYLCNLQTKSCTDKVYGTLSHRHSISLRTLIGCRGFP